MVSLWQSGKPVFRDRIPRVSSIECRSTESALKDAGRRSNEILVVVLVFNGEVLDNKISNECNRRVDTHARALSSST